VELKALGGYTRLQAKHPEVKVILSVPMFTEGITKAYVQVWGLISEDILQLEG
jgi:hypothetical protein